MKIMRFIHKWIGLLLGLQLILWMFSGFMMALLDHDVVEGHNLRKHGGHHEGSIADFGPLVEPASLADLFREKGVIKQLGLTVFRHSPAYQVRTESGTYLYDARSGEQIIIDREMARVIAQDDYAGDGRISNVTEIVAPTMETRESAGPGWRVDFEDTTNSSFYLSAQTGKIWERRNDTWRVFDIFWMLHIMDYENRKDFNNAFVILSGWIVLWLTVSGMVMLVENFRRGDFGVLSNLRQRGASTTLTIWDESGAPERKIVAKGRKTLFDALASADIHLPSTCGGGGSCGLCRVQLSPAPAPTAADKREIPDMELQKGFRLSCQHRTDSNAKVRLPEDLMSAEDFEAVVTEASFVTPYIREIRLKRKEGSGIRFRPGSYMQVTIPPYSSSLDHLDIPAALQGAWRNSHALREVGTEAPLHRTYSMANAPQEEGDDYVLNVRVALPAENGVALPVGAGSAYMARVRVGEHLQIRGPFGDFALKEGDREKIFIGGGAGMAPLRSMLVHLLRHENSSAPVSFWYGARTEMDIYYQETFDQLERDFANFHWHVALSGLGEKATSWRGLRGYIHEVVARQYLEEHPDLSKCEFYLCGPPKMLEATIDLLKRLGVSDQQIAFDDFGI